jgi:hypothetical protein
MPQKEAGDNGGPEMEVHIIISAVNVVLVQT